MTMGAIKSSLHLLVYFCVPSLPVSVPRTMRAHLLLVLCTVQSDGHAWPSNSQWCSVKDKICLTFLVSHQLSIPKSYLSNFAFTQKKKNDFLSSISSSSGWRAFQNDFLVSSNCGQRVLASVCHMVAFIVLLAVEVALRRLCACTRCSLPRAILPLSLVGAPDIGF